MICAYKGFSIQWKGLVQIETIKAGSSRINKSVSYNKKDIIFLGDRQSISREVDFSAGLWIYCYCVVGVQSGRRTWNG